MAKVLQHLTHPCIDFCRRGGSHVKLFMDHRTSVMESVSMLHAAARRSWMAHRHHSAVLPAETPSSPRHFTEPAAACCPQMLADGLATVVVCTATAFRPLLLDAACVLQKFWRHAQGYQSCFLRAVFPHYWFTLNDSNVMFVICFCVFVFLLRAQFAR